MRPRKPGLQTILSRSRPKPYQMGWFHPQNDVKDLRHSALDAITKTARRDEFSPSLGCTTLTNNRRHLGLDKLKVKGYSNARVSRYPNAVSTFQLTRLTTSEMYARTPVPLRQNLAVQCAQEQSLTTTEHYTATCAA